MIGSAISGVPTPNQWLESTLRSLGMSNASLARLIGRSRTEVQRWINGREQIPRHHLAEIAAQIGTSQDLTYALKLKECEDFADHLKRRLREFARIAQSDPTALESATFDLLLRKTSAESTSFPEDLTSLLIYNMTHASFIFRLWADAAARRDFSSILSPDNMKLHIRYPANHFLGLVLDFGNAGGALAEYREMGLAHLRGLASLTRPERGYRLAGHHAVHMLSRFGSAEDRAMVSDLVDRAAVSPDLLSTRLGYAGLMLRPDSEPLVEKYIWLLQHNHALAQVDMQFEAVHYGDVALDDNREVPDGVSQYGKSVASVIRRLDTPELPAVHRELELLRLIGLLQRVGVAVFDSTSAARLRAALSGVRGESANLLLKTIGSDAV